MNQTIKKFIGYSQSEVLLIKSNNKYFVRKINNIERNLERYERLFSLGLPVPDILNISSNYYDMDYIPNHSIKQYLLTNSPKKLIEFIHQVIDRFSCNVELKDYTNIYLKKLEHIDFSEFNFTKDQLISRLPRELPCSEYHGDLTLENILFNTKEKRFVLIDPITTEYDSFVFDLAKLKQDLICNWFIRNEDIHITSKLKKISDELNHFDYYDNNYLLILMLLRVVPYVNKEDKLFLKEEIKKLWK